MTPVSFPYRNMGTIRESHPQNNANKKELIPNYFWIGKE